MFTHLIQGRSPVLFLAFTAVLLGCNPSQKAIVTGKVTLNGEPLDHGAVTFVAGSKTKANTAAGNIMSDGTYLVQIGQSGKIISGEYQVSVLARGPSTPHPLGGPPMPGELTTPARYADVATSGLRFRIRPGENTIDIALVSDTPETDEAVSQEESLGDNGGVSDGDQSATEDGTDVEAIPESSDESANQNPPESGAPSEEETGGGDETT